MHAGTSHVGQDVYLSDSASLDGCTRGRRLLLRSREPEKQWQAIRRRPPLLRPHCIPNRAIMVECPPPQKQPANPLWRWRVNLGVTGQDGGPDNESALDTRQQPPPLPPPSETRKILQPAPGGGGFNQVAPSWSDAAGCGRSSLKSGLRDEPSPTVSSTCVRA